MVNKTFKVSSWVLLLLYVPLLFIACGFIIFPAVNGFSTSGIDYAIGSVEFFLSTLFFTTPVLLYRAVRNTIAHTEYVQVRWIYPMGLVLFGAVLLLLSPAIVVIGPGAPNFALVTVTTLRIVSGVLWALMFFALFFETRPVPNTANQVVENIEKTETKIS